MKKVLVTIDVNYNVNNGNNPSFLTLITFIFKNELTTGNKKIREY